MAAPLEVASRVEETMELGSLTAESEQRETVKIPTLLDKDEEAEKTQYPPADIGFACIISEIPCPALEEALQVPLVSAPAHTHTHSS